MALSASLLAACGGGGGDAAASTTEPATSPAPAQAASAPDSTAATCGLPNFNADALAKINAFRSMPRTCGTKGRFPAVPALRWNSQLQQSATGHSRDMAANNYFSHTGLDGLGVDKRVEAAGYAWRAVGENIAAQPATVAEVMAGWQASDGHCANLMNPDFTEVGLACVPGTATSRYATYWTMNLGRPAD